MASPHHILLLAVFFADTPTLSAYTIRDKEYGALEGYVPKGRPQGPVKWREVSAELEGEQRRGLRGSLSQDLIQRGVRRL